MKFAQDKPYRGKEFDPCGQKASAASKQDSESSAADGNLDQEDGQIEGLFGSSLGRESGMLTSDEAAAEYVARDAEIARQEILEEEAEDRKKAEQKS